MRVRGVRMWLGHADGADDAHGPLLEVQSLCGLILGEEFVQERYRRSDNFCEMRERFPRPHLVAVNKRLLDQDKAVKGGPRVEDGGGLRPSHRCLP
ncbi:hypothetical protein KKHFBJBL_01721 [Brevundimonas sp. NIBR11]|nr:hypothetical protein KKHFBJBL_01721 [Brevundimonas sp. NIBR11]